MQITCKFSGGLSAQPSNLPPVSARNLEKTVNRNGSLKEFSREDGAEGVAAIACGGSKASQSSSNAFDVKTLSNTTSRKSLNFDLQQKCMSKITDGIKYAGILLVWQKG